MLGRRSEPVPSPRAIADMIRTESGSSACSILTVPSLRRTGVPFFRMFAADRLTPTSRAAADMYQDQPSARSSMNRFRASDSAYDPVPSKRDETTYENSFQMGLVTMVTETTPSQRPGVVDTHYSAASEQDETTREPVSDNPRCDRLCEPPPRHEPLLERRRYGRSCIGVQPGLARINDEHRHLDVVAQERCRFVSHRGVEQTPALRVS